MDLNALVRTAWRHLLVLVATTCLAVVHTWPLVPLRKTHLLGGGSEDPWVNAWHVEWMRACIRETHTPFFAPRLHWPVGAEMYWHSQMPTKTLLSVILLPFMGVVEAANVIIFSTFVLSGLTAWWLIRDVLRRAGRAGVRADVAAFVGAAVFNFSRYHFCHAHAHMNLAALEALPVFVLCALRYFEVRSSRWWLLGAGASALYAMGCELYYVYYLAMFMLCWVVIALWQEGPLLRRSNARHPIVVRSIHLAVVSAIFCLPIAIPLISHLKPAPWSIHGSSSYPADPLMLVVPDVLSRWAFLIPEPLATAFRKLQNGILNDVEGGLFIGFATMALAFIGARKQWTVVRSWVLIGGVFLVLSLGPFLHLGGVDTIPAQLIVVFIASGLMMSPRIRQSRRGREVALLLLALAVLLFAFGMSSDGTAVSVRVPLPYLFFKHVAPFFSRGGMPVRFLIMTQLCLGVLVGFGVLEITERVGTRFKYLRWAAPACLAAALIAVSVDSMNRPFEMTPVPHRQAIFDEIRDDPDANVAVFTDHVVGQFEQLYHRRPVSFARQSRVPMREFAYVHMPVQRALVEFDHLTPTALEASEMRTYLRDNGFKYFIGHRRACREAIMWKKTLPDSESWRSGFLVDVLEAKLVYEDDELQVFRFW